MPLKKNKITLKNNFKQKKHKKQNKKTEQEKEKEEEQTKEKEKDKKQTQHLQQHSLLNYTVMEREKHVRNVFEKGSQTRRWSALCRV